MILRDRIASGLKAKTVTKPSEYAQRYRVMPNGLFSFDNYPWAIAMHDAENPLVICKKAAQMGVTEAALNKVFYLIDYKGTSVLYILPTSTPDATEFSSARFDAALDCSEHLSNLFNDVRNVRHKRAGSANLYIRGSRSRSQLKSVPVGFIVYDEFDEMPEATFTLAQERMSGHTDKQSYIISTPTIAGFGVDRYFKDSTQDHFFFRCPCCGKMTELVFPDCVEMTGDSFDDKDLVKSFYKCKECKSRLKENITIGEWVKGKDNINRGFYINQLYSSTITPYELCYAYFKSLLSKVEEQEFYNSKIGITHEVKGARVTDEDIASCVGSYHVFDNDYSADIVTMGVDIGGWCHVTIKKWKLKKTNSTDIHLNAIPQLIHYTKVLEYSELDQFMLQYNVNFCVIDAQPDTRKSKEFKNRHPGKVQLCYYTESTGKDLVESESSVKADRTCWLDLTLGRYKRKGILLPLGLDEEYKTHIKSLVRSYERNKDGNPIVRYKNSDQDHYGHSDNYSEIGFSLALKNSGNRKTYR